MPVLVVNADPTFDLPAVARRHGLDLYRNEELRLVDARDEAPPSLQTERLWGDWPERLEGNRSNLRAELDRFLTDARRARDKIHVVLFVLDEFAPDDAAKLVNKDFLAELFYKIQGRDARTGKALMAGTQNVWTTALVRPVIAHEEIPARVLLANEAGFVNNIFVSTFYGSPSDRSASDFVIIRVLASILLDRTESRRFLQIGTQNAYPALAVQGPSEIPIDTESRFIRHVLRLTLDRLESHNAPTAGSTAISSAAERLRGLVDRLVRQTKDELSLPPTMNIETADLRVAQIQRAAHTSGAGPVRGSLFESAVDAILTQTTKDIRWRPADRFQALRNELHATIDREAKEIHRTRTHWTRVRPQQLKAFGGINVDIMAAIEEISAAAVGARGNDVAVLEERIAAVRQEAETLKKTAQDSRRSMVAANFDSQDEIIDADVEAKLRNFEFELEQVPQLRSVGFFFATILLAALLPYLWHFAGLPRIHGLHVGLSIFLPLVVTAVTIFALLRRRAKLSRAANDLRKAIQDWRNGALAGFNAAMRYQIYTLGIGWLDSIADRLEKIRHSIWTRDQALEACREDLGPDATTAPDVHLTPIVDEAVRQLTGVNWDKWIIEFLRHPRRDSIKADALVHYGDDLEERRIPVRGLPEGVIVLFKTPEAGTPEPAP